jgi:hypothetical protein
MHSARPSTAAVRAVNQYRRRDVLTYLSLRYYLQNSAARRPGWGVTVAIPLVTQRTLLPYFHARHFKDRGDDGEAHHRSMHLPAANEALAEAVLLEACAAAPGFENPKNVYSYDLATGDEKEGIFRNYFIGLRRRHDDIALACKEEPKAVVRYGDIQRFYPSIGVDVALDAWRDQCERSNVPKRLFELGAKLVDDHRAVQTKVTGTGGGGVLTGPMFSHLLGNLVLRGVDDQMGRLHGVRYFRYVDDIVLVGTERAVEGGYARLWSMLSDLGLRLHDDTSAKHLVVGGREWLRGEHDFQDTRRSNHWKNLVGGLKQYLVAHPGEGPMVQAALQDEGVRLPVLDYANAIRERSYLMRLRELAAYRWFRSRVRRRALLDLIDQMKNLRETYHREAQVLLDKVETLDGYDRKRAIPKLRYRLGRLSFLAGPHALSALAEQARRIPELAFHAAVLEAVASGDVDKVLSFGTNAVQAVAQILRAANKPALIANPVDTEVRTQGAAVLAFNGVEITGGGGGNWRNDDLVRLAMHGADYNLMTSPDAFLRELACLHGHSDQPRHPEMLETAFDEAQELSLDVLNELQGSVSP